MAYHESVQGSITCCQADYCCPSSSKSFSPTEGKVESRAVQVYILLVFSLFYNNYFSRILEYRGTIGPNENPNAWWRVYHSQFPLLRKFWLALSAFPATSTSAERVFNMDGLVLSPNRQQLLTAKLQEYNIYDSRRSLDPERTSDMVICRDFWLSRDGADDRFQLCPRCPPFPSPEACYRISCSKHNKEQGSIAWESVGELYSLDYLCCLFLNWGEIPSPPIYVLTTYVNLE